MLFDRVGANVRSGWEVDTFNKYPRLHGEIIWIAKQLPHCLTSAKEVEKLWGSVKEAREQADGPHPQEGLTLHLLQPFLVSLILPALCWPL